ncbi:PIN domain-containing protein [Halorussus salilacus]|uniref:type II toxin-antitoxin system VapC family toxin n=1 Tax=Halorussus salilacus TaxID=2953750 RepID=UPI00209CD30C|nr:PIN domain-containing protein [Halorussus salilacus]USZ67122.1 PIN domain-containing protein [Halorussus salilacus]
MGEVLIDANVVYGFRMPRDQWHDSATRIVRSMDDGELPRGRVTNATLSEILSPIQKRVGHDPAVATLEFLERSAGFRVRYLAQSDFVRGRELFRQSVGVELSDAMTVAHMRRTSIEYIYSFDDDFDRFEGITRLSAPVNPFRPS